MYTPTKPLIAFFRNTPPVSYDKGYIIYRSDVSDASVFYLHSGYIKSYTIKDSGDISILAFYGPSSIFPLRPALRDKGFSTVFNDRSGVYFESMTDVELHRRRQHDFMEYIEAEPLLYREVVYILLDNLDIYISRAEGMEFRYAQQRIAYQLLSLGAKFGVQQEQKVEIMLPLTHQELASSLDMARETVSREMEKLKQAELLEMKDHKIIINDVAGIGRVLH